MLVLKRRVNEKVIIRAGDEQIEVEVLGVQSDAVRLGFTAARHVQIHRDDAHIITPPGAANAESPAARPADAG